MSDLPILLQHVPTSRQPLRITVVTETYPPEINGVAMTLERMVTALLSRGHAIQLVRPRQHPDQRPSDLPGLEEVFQTGVPIPGYAGLKMGLPAANALAQRWAGRRPDIVHIATEGPLGWSALAAANKLGLPVTSDFHTNFHTYSRHYGMGLLRKPINAYLRRLHNQTLCTLVPTETLRSELAQSGYRNLQVVARGVDTELFKPDRRRLDLRRDWNAEKNDVVALHVGRLAREKNLPLVMEAYRKMRAANPRTKLVVVGDGPERTSLEKHHPDALFAGMRSGVDLAEHYASADVFLFPSTTETYGNVTVEAMASGLAVVAYDYAAAREHICNGKNGLLGAFDKAQEFLSLAERLANHPDEIREMGREARLTSERLDWEDIHDRFEHILTDIVRREGHHHAQSTQLSFVPD